jgi:hypothetical protein
VLPVTTRIKVDQKEVNRNRIVQLCQIHANAAAARLAWESNQDCAGKAVVQQCLGKTWQSILVPRFDNEHDLKQAFDWYSG